MQIVQFRWCHLPYKVVHDLLRTDPARLIAPAVHAGALHGSEVVATFEVELAGIDVGARVVVEVGELEEQEPVATLRIPLNWRAVDHTGLFPIMEAVLEVYPVDEERTQLGFDGHYQPPLGPLGAALDHVVLHRVAEATVGHFLDGVVEELKTEAAGSAPDRT